MKFAADLLIHSALQIFAYCVFSNYNKLILPMEVMTSFNFPVIYIGVPQCIAEINIIVVFEWQKENAIKSQIYMYTCMYYGHFCIEHRNTLRCRKTNEYFRNILTRVCFNNLINRHYNTTFLIYITETYENLHHLWYYELNYL